MSKKTEQKPAEEWEQVGVVAVDSGRITITDYPNEPEVQHAWDLMEDAGWPQHLQLKFSLGHDGAGVVVSAGLGDGVYPVFVRHEDVPEWGRRVAEVKVTFLPHPVLG